MRLGPKKGVLREANLGSVQENFRMARTVPYQMPVSITVCGQMGVQATE